MAKLTVVFGVMLVLLGGIGFVGTGSVHPTALIPMWFGLVLCLSGVLANTEDTKRRMLWMHVAVTVGLLGFLGAAVMVLKSVLSSAPIAHPRAVEEQGVMGLLCAIFVGLCVRSFIAARRNRTVPA